MQRIDKARTAEMTAGDGERSVVAKISTASMDHDGEVMLPSGADLSVYKANPVVLFAHDAGALPVGTGKISRYQNGLRAKVTFAERPASHPDAAEWLPDTLLHLFQKKVLRGFSIGAMVKEWREPTIGETRMHGDGLRRVITKWSLYEFSVVPIPANQEALAEAVSKGITPGDSKVCSMWNMAKGVLANTEKRRTIRVPRAIRVDPRPCLRVD